MKVFKINKKTIAAMLGILIVFLLIGFLVVEYGILENTAFSSSSAGGVGGIDEQAYNSYYHNQGICTPSVGYTKCYYRTDYGVDRVFGGPIGPSYVKLEFTDVLGIEKDGYFVFNDTDNHAKVKWKATFKSSDGTECAIPTTIKLNAISGAEYQDGPVWNPDIFSSVYQCQTAGFSGTAYQLINYENVYDITMPDCSIEGELIFTDMYTYLDIWGRSYSGCTLFEMSGSVSNSHYLMACSYLYIGEFGMECYDIKEAYCVDDTDCGQGYACDNSGDWTTWMCVEDATTPTFIKTEINIFNSDNVPLTFNIIDASPQEFLDSLNSLTSVIVQPGDQVTWLSELIDITSYTESVDYLVQVSGSGDNRTTAISTMEIAVSPL